MSDDFMEYHKINSLFKRDSQTNRFMVGEWATEELEFLQDAKWDWTEKVDGTNIRIQVATLPDDTVDVEFRGRTDNAQFSKPLYDVINVLVLSPEFLEQAFTVLTRGKPVTEPITAILFGEGYGAGVQKGGAYRATPGFILYDVLIDNQWWMPRSAIQQIGEDLGLDVVPYVGRMTIHEAIDLVRSPYFKSYWPEAKPEGLVGVPAAPLFDRRHRRIVTKVKVRDFDYVS